MRPRFAVRVKAGIEARAHVTVDIVYTADKGTKFMFEEYRKKDWGKAYDVVIHDDDRPAGGDVGGEGVHDALTRHEEVVDDALKV